MKIVITGGLGYIGTELCKLYSGEARFKEIIVVDNRFVSERVKQLTDWGINFINGDINDSELMKKVLEDCDIIFHLAGTTDVAYTKTESNDEKDLTIKRNGVDATKVILNNLSKKTKLIFPSTHVVFEGLTETKFDIDESFTPNPVLSYAKGKYESELDIIESDINFVILRLGTVYGYSTDTMRINIMPNLFSKITSLNGTIKLFSGGVQYKSLVNILDVVRSMKFLAESDVSKEIYNITNENLTIKQVAEICKKINPNVTILETQDEIPNLGYTLTNNKLLSTGFSFRYNIETSIKEMVKNWSKKERPDELEFFIKGDKEFKDERGIISNYELTEPINLIGYIESKKNTIRANHYHPIQEQKCLLISGKYISVTKDLSNPKSTIETRIVKKGDLSVIKPNVAHTMVFLEDSVFLNLVRGEREHKNYGITHTIPYILVDENLKKILVENYKEECRVCANINLKDGVSLGLSPLANNLLESKLDSEKLYPLELKHCENCQNTQLSIVVPPTEMFSNYLYTSSTTKTFKKHFQDTAEKYIKMFNLNTESTVVDIGSNDGVFLKPLKELGINVVGVEPAANLAELCNKNDIYTINDFFNKNVVSKIIEKFGKVSLVTASNVFAHSDNIDEIVEGVSELLNENGSFIVEVQYFLKTIKDLTFDNIYHEHVNYWTTTSLIKFFERFNLFVNHVEEIDTHGGSIRVFVGKTKNQNNSVSEFLNEENQFGINTNEVYKKFNSDINKIKNNVLTNFSKLKQKYNKIVGYGSPAKATTALNFYGIDTNFLDFIVEDNKLKVDKIIPGVKLPITNIEKLYEEKPDVVVVLAWNFFDEIIKNHNQLIVDGVKFISIRDLQKENFL
jgi:nucleoside-diphosphate-sugar epimerase/dTDP-4-dehydrorhamnose 3,5-epimerase-like enzyme